VNAQLNAPKCVRSALAMPGHFSPVSPLADAGLTMTNGNGRDCGLRIADCGLAFFKRGV